MALSHRGTSLIIKSSCGVYSTVHNKNSWSRITFLLFFIKFIPYIYSLYLHTDSWYSLKVSHLSELLILVCSVLSRAFSQECSGLLLQQQRLSTMIWMKKEGTPHRHSQTCDFHPAFILRNAVTFSSPPVVGKRCSVHKLFSATALFDKYFHSFSSKQLSSSDQCAKSEAYINGNEDSSINSRWSASIQ